jgi:hypothetical protein
VSSELFYNLVTLNLIKLSFGQMLGFQLCNCFVNTSHYFPNDDCRKTNIKILFSRYFHSHNINNNLARVFYCSYITNILSKNVNIKPSCPIISQSFAKKYVCLLILFFDQSLKNIFQLTWVGKRWVRPQNQVRNDLQTIKNAKRQTRTGSIV